MFWDHPEYDAKKYQALLENWNERFFNIREQRRALWGNDLQRMSQDDVFDSADVAKRIFLALNPEKKLTDYWNLFGNLAQHPLQDLRDAEELLPAFEDFLKNEQMDLKGQRLLKTVFPHLSTAYALLYGQEEEKPSFQEFLRPMNEVLQGIEQGQAYFSPSFVFDHYIGCESGILTKKEMSIRITLLSKVGRKIKDCLTLMQIYDDFTHHSRVFPETVTAAFLENFVEKIVPRYLNKGDIFAAQSNKWGCGSGKGIARGVGAATFAYKCYATKITPKGINDLIQMSYETLAGSFEKFEQIRKDALGLWFPRDPIHDSTPGVNEIIEKMVAYYDAPSDQKEIARRRLVETSKRIKIWSAEILCDLEKYDMSSRRTGEKHIDILRRIRDNMNQNTLKVPVTENKRLNILAQKVSCTKIPSVDKMMPLVSLLNQEMMSAVEKEQTGFSPEMVNLIAWTDRRLSNALNNMDFEKQSGFYKSDECLDVLVFSALTHSAAEKFDKKEIEDFFHHSVQKAFDMEDAYQALASRQNELLFGLYEQYDKDYEAMEKTPCAKIMIDARKERAGSGNVLKALQNLTLAHEASTAVGKRMRQEREGRAPYRPLMKTQFYR